MTISKKLEGTALTVMLEGRLDTTTSPELEAYLLENLEGVTELTFDFEKLDYISSAGLRILLSTHKKMSALGGLKIVHVSEDISEIFEVTGFADILNIELII